MALEALLFDFCGTITSNEPWRWRSIRFAMEQHMPEQLQEITDDELLSYVGVPYEHRFEQILAVRGMDDDALVQQLANEARSNYNDQGLVPLVPGVDALMEMATAAGIRIGVVSNASHSDIERTLRKHQLLQHIELILGCDDVQFPKPHPYPYEKALLELGVDTNNALAFEDSPTGVESARIAGISVVGLTTTFPQQDLQHAVKTMSDFTDFTIEEANQLLA